MAGILTLNTTLAYADSSSGSFTTLTNLQSLPSIGNGSPNTIDVTVLTDIAHTYIKGLQDNGGSAFEFGFLYDGTFPSGGGSGTPDAQFLTLNSFGETPKYWKVTTPDGLTATFHGACSVALDEIAVDDAIHYTLSVVVDTPVVYA
jgi:hypothetical protein